MSDNCSDYGCECDKPSDTTNERPDEVGLWFRYGEPYAVTHVEPDVCCYAIQSNGIPTHLRCVVMEGGWSKAVPASELATLQADCERWSRLYAKEADQLTAHINASMDFRVQLAGELGLVNCDVPVLIAAAKQAAWNEVRDAMGFADGAGNFTPEFIAQIHFEVQKEWHQSDKHSAALSKERNRLRKQLAALQSDCERWSREYARQADELVAVKADLEKEQRDHDGTLKERVECEEAIDKIYLAVVGLPPEWSNIFDYRDAVDAVEYAMYAKDQDLGRVTMYREAAESRLAEVKARLSKEKRRADHFEEACGIAPSMSLLITKDQRAEVERLRAQLASAKLAANVPSTFTGTLADFIEQDNFEDAERFKSLTRAREAAEGRVEQLAAVCRFVIAGDYAGLIEAGKAMGAKLDWSGACDAATYKYAGDYEADARHTYPDREMLVEAVLKAALASPATTPPAAGELNS